MFLHRHRHGGANLPSRIRSHRSVLAVAVRNLLESRGTAYSPAAARPKPGEQTVPAGESAVWMRDQRRTLLRGREPPVWATHTANSHTGYVCSQGRAFSRCVSEPCHTDGRGTAYSSAAARPKSGEQTVPAGESAVWMRDQRGTLLRGREPPVWATHTANSHTGYVCSQGRAFSRCVSEPCHTDGRGTAYSPAAARPKSGEQTVPAGESAVRMRDQRRSACGFPGSSPVSLSLAAAAKTAYDEPPACACWVPPSETRLRP
jgi:hypothetical protein